MIENRAPPNKLRRVEINFGTGTKAKRYYERLVSLMPSIKSTLDKLGNKDHADLLHSWQRSAGYRIAEAPHWTVELDAMTWQALSRGLRAQGTQGRSLYEWIQRNHTRTYYPRIGYNAPPPTWMTA